MSSFSEFYQSLLQIKKTHEKSTHIKIEHDSDNEIVKIFGEKTSSLARAKNGLEELLELAYTTAEHHPYWNLLYNTSQISKVLLEKWDDNLSLEELHDMEWCIKELQHACAKLKENKGLAS